MLYLLYEPIEKENNLIEKENNLGKKMTSRHSKCNTRLAKQLCTLLFKFVDLHNHLDRTIN